MPAARRWIMPALLFLLAAAATSQTLAMGMLGGAEPAALAPGKSFRDCATCPEMVVVPAGSFMMGAAHDEEEHAEVARRDRGRAEPRHAVLIGLSFAAGRFEITRGEFAQFVNATGRQVEGCWLTVKGEWRLYAERSWRVPGFAQTDGDPVVCVSWEDAKAYTVWLGQVTQQQYRLLNETEWEYLARAGSLTARPWGAELGRNFTVCANCGSQWDGLRPAPAGIFSPNRFGIHDMLGNVSEWVEDCWHPDYHGAPENATPWTNTGCELRTFRGGSWMSSPHTVRSSFRDRDVPSYRSTAVGFRVARTISP